MSYELHYAEVNLEDGDIPCTHFNKNDERVDMIESIIYQVRQGIVYIMCIDYNGDDKITSVYIFHAYRCVAHVLKKKLNAKSRVFLFEYPSYQDAYENALDMQENNPFCYPD